MCFFDKLYYWRLRRQKEIDDKNSQLAYAYTEGMGKGVEKGKAEEKLEMARRMKEENVPIEIIIECSGLDQKNIEEL